MRGGVGRKNALNMELSGGVNQLTLLHVHQESKMSQKICTEDSLLYLGNDENPGQCSSETEVEGERPFAVRSNWGIVHGHK